MNHRVQSMLQYPFSWIKTFEVKKVTPFWAAILKMGINCFNNHIWKHNQHIDCNHILISINTNRYNESLRNFGRHFEFCVFLICHRIYFWGLSTGNTLLHLEASLKNSALYAFFPRKNLKWLDYILMKIKDISLIFCINDDYNVLNMYALCQTF